MAIHRKVKDKRPHSNVSLEETVAVFSYDPDKLAQVIVDLWTDPKDTLKRDADGNPTTQAVKDATAAINGAGFNLKRAVVISEEEHDNDYTMQQPNEVVFVLPDPKRVTSITDTHILHTAKLLMACTPNGI